MLAAEPLGLLPTTRLFAQMDGAVLQSFIQTFRLKFDIGFWRPFQAIAAAADDGNPATAPQTGWTPLVTNPSYSDYTSGHAADGTVTAGPSGGCTVTGPGGRPSRGRNTIGSPAARFTADPPPGCHSKCRWFVDPALPVLPTYPMVSPAPTLPLAEL